MWDGAVWGAALRGVPGARKLAIRQIATLSVLARNGGAALAEALAGGWRRGTAPGLSVAFMRGGVPRRGGDRSRRVRAAPRRWRPASGARLSALAPTPSRRAPRGRRCARSRREGARRPDSLDRAAKADPRRARRRRRGGGCRPASRRRRRAGARRQLRELLLDAADAPGSRCARRRRRCL
jgi:hypothetical protein